jgi:hypothetical protein
MGQFVLMLIRSSGTPELLNAYQYILKAAMLVELILMPFYGSATNRTLK